jgi:hypothetical protein
MPTRVLLQFVRPTMRLACPIWDGEGKPAAGRGSYLREPMVRMLRRMGLFSVEVDDLEESELAAWETVRPLEQELLALEERFAQEEPSSPTDALRRAITEHLRRRAERLAGDPALTAARDPRQGQPGDDATREDA